MTNHQPPFQELKPAEKIGAMTHTLKNNLFYSLSKYSYVCILKIENVTPKTAKVYVYHVYYNEQENQYKIQKCYCILRPHQLYYQRIQKEFFQRIYQKCLKKLGVATPS